MANSIPILKVQLADPGVGFQLDLSGHTIADKENLVITVTATMSDPPHLAHKATLTIDPPITETTIEAIVPFGCPAYQPGAKYTVTIEAVIGNDPNRTLTTLLTLEGQDGKFDYNPIRNILLPLPNNVIKETAEKKTPGLLKEGEYLLSKNKRYMCRLGMDGALKIYDLTKDDHSTPDWSSGSAGQLNSSGIFYACMQRNGNFCIYHGHPNTVFWDEPNNPVWRTWQQSGQKYQLLLEDDRGKHYLELTNDGELHLKKSVQPDRPGSADFIILHLKTISNS